MPPRRRSRRGPQPRPEQEAARRNLLDDFNEYGPETGKLQKKVSTNTALREILGSPSLSPSLATRASPQKEENTPQGMFTGMCLPQGCACCLFFLCNSGARWNLWHHISFFISLSETSLGVKVAAPETKGNQPLQAAQKIPARLKTFSANIAPQQIELLSPPANKGSPGKENAPPQGMFNVMCHLQRCACQSSFLRHFGARKVL